MVGVILPMPFTFPLHFMIVCWLTIGFCFCFYVPREYFEQPRIHIKLFTFLPIDP